MHTCTIQNERIQPPLLLAEKAEQKPRKPSAPLPDATDVKEADRARFWRNVKIGTRFECWEWLAWTREGYGRFSISGKQVSAHRFSFQINGGKTTAERPFVLHSCHNRLCVNPSHLRAGTQKENMKDMICAGRQAVGAKVLGGKIRKLSPTQAMEIRDKIKRISAKEIAAEYGITRRLVYMIRSGETWTSIPL